MFEAKPMETPYDSSHLIKKPIKRCNINHSSTFMHSFTRIPVTQAIYSKKKQKFEETLHHVISDLSAKLEEKDGKMTEDAIISDHFNRSFSQITLPELSRTHFKPLFEPYHYSPPHWFCDLPSTSFKTEPKIYLEEAMNPTLKRKKVTCSYCGISTKYPIYASLNYVLCNNCIKSANFPGNTTSLDYFKVEKSEGLENSLWSVEELNQLLEIFEDIGDDWNQCGQRMGKTPGECLLQFLRLPMYDRYYVSDPLSVPPGDIPNEEESSKYPFMIAPDPIATFVEFIHILCPSIGNVVADVAQKEIETILSSKQGTIFMNSQKKSENTRNCVPSIIKLLLETTKREAGLLSIRLTEEINQLMMGIAQQLNTEVQKRFSVLETSIREFQHQPNSCVPGHLRSEG